jgi:DNA phosphorothioation-associated putative methyltransferase
MDFKAYSRCLSELAFGKRLNETVYIFSEHLSDCDTQLNDFVNQFGTKFNFTTDFNVIKFWLKEFKVSFLSYPGFFETPHPVLKKSISINLSTGKVQKFDYSKSENPPILHRKETLLKPNHPLIPIYRNLTESEEKEGLYQNPKIIGFKQNWEKLLSEKGIEYEGHNLIKVEAHRKIHPESDCKVERYKTAISRYNFSRPIQTLEEYSIIGKEIAVFDYGCGQGDDVRGLRNMGIPASGWDPIYYSNEPKKNADIVNLGFVLNVIEDQVERTKVLQDAFALAEKLLVVSCQLATSNTQELGRPYKDGILTRNNTFQKYYRQDELRQYIEDVLDVSPVAVERGIFYIFRDPVDQQEFISNRSRRNIDWEKISQRLYPNRAERLTLKRNNLYERNKDLLDSFWKTMIDFGRIPATAEFERFDELREKFGTPKSAKQLFIEKYGEKTLQDAFDEKRKDLLVYMSLSNFKKRVPYIHLPRRIQNDIKTFIGGYKRGMEQSKEMLFSIGKPDLITDLCNQTQFGLLDHKALYIHKSLINDLHPILRIYVGCAEFLYGDLNQGDIIKIHKKSGKVTLLKYDDFESKNLPELLERIKINLREQRVDIFDHQIGFKKQLLYFKDLYVGKDHPNVLKWAKFSNRLRKIGLDEKDVIGPSMQEFQSLIERKGLTHNLNRKQKNIQQR